MAALERRQEMYEEGDSVMALWPPDSSWYPAVITSITKEGFTSDEDSSDSGDSCDPALEDSVDARRPPTQTDPAPKARQVKRRQFKRRPWTAQEKKDVTEGLQRFILLKKIPGKRDIESSCPVALQTRTWKNIKDFCRNTMTLKQS
ncbi:uncharacterized protein LOC117304448 isoform X2 [Asterias rubens]|uniref:uncharacterized protein LOC117304448 isoform X2 n=1 Tax=Asterias rubens TaxID=7604 RepID=UPI001455B8B9|nr:uncharacterized protein LOC117304448 isoform X2 [Asterias rubens]